MQLGEQEIWTGIEVLTLIEIQKRLIFARDKVKLFSVVLNNQIVDWLNGNAGRKDSSAQLQNGEAITPSRYRLSNGSILFSASCGITVLWIATQWFWSSNSAYNGNNGDHFYYVAYAHMLNGVPYRNALELSTEYFHYLRPSVVLDYEWMDVAIAPLIYPRVVLSSLIAVSMRIFGENGAWIPGLTFGCLTHIFWWRLLIARFSIGIAGLTMLILSLSPQLTELRFGIYTESPLIFFMTIWFYFTWKAFQPNQSASATYFIPLVLLIPLICLTRQSLMIPFISFAAFAVRWALSTTKNERMRMNLVGIFLVVTGSIAIQLVINKWAPYDATVFAMRQNDASSRLGLVGMAPENMVRIFFLETKRLFTFKSTFDPIFFLTILLCPVIAIKRLGWGRSVGMISVLFVSLIVTYLNGRATGFRYLVLVIPATLCALTLDSQVSFKRAEDMGKVALRSAAAIFLLMILVITNATSFTMARTKTIDWHLVSSATFPATWPLKIDSGYLGCAGDDFQIWFKSLQGDVYAVSGPALQRRFFSPSIDEISAKPRDQLVSPTLDLMEYGMKLCGAEYMKQ